MLSFRRDTGMSIVIDPREKIMQIWYNNVLIHAGSVKKSNKRSLILAIIENLHKP